MTVVRSLHRYPVKSVVGEQVDALDVDGRGVVGDRRWAVVDADGKLGSGKSSRRFRKMDGLLRLASAYDGDVPVLTFPDGRMVRGDDPDVHQALTAYVGRPVTLGQEAEVSHLDEGPLHLVTTASLASAADALGRDVPPARMRPNLVVDTGTATGLVENDWVGRQLAVGDEVVLHVRGPMDRCVMVGMDQVGLPAERELLGALAGINDTCLGVVLDVVRGGRVTVGNEVRVG